MKKYIAIASFLLCSALGLQSCISQKVVVNREVESSKFGALLLGHQATEQFQKEPFSQWFQQEYNDYTPNTEVIKKLKKEKVSSAKIVVFLGTWQEESQREFPKIMKVLDVAGYPKNRLEIIALNSKNESPTGDETPYNIQKIPTIVVKKYGKQLGRIIETPKQGSWEEDLLNILEKK